MEVDPSSAGIAADARTVKAEELRYLVAGMDCADCVNRITDLVARTPGASEGHASFVTQTLKLRLDEHLTSRDKFENTLRALGYEPSLQAGGPAHRTTGVANDAETPPWYASRQGRLVLTSGTLLTLAFALGFAVPRLATWGYLAATLIAVAPLARRAWNGARLGNPFTIDMLVTLAAVGALLIGAAPEGALVVFLFAVGELLEGIAAGKARAGITALAKLAPKTALLIDGETTREVPAASLGIGDVVQVQPGARVPADGVILTGDSSLDDSPVTGESVPITKGPGDGVFAGSINIDGVLTVRVERDPSDNTIARIIHLVEEAQEAKAPTARLIDRFSRYYTPVVMLVAAFVAIAPPLLFDGVWSVWLYKALALLLIGCPCALVLSVPAAVTSGISAAARHGLLIKGGAALEMIGNVDIIAFDKTGTLTRGQPKVTDVVPLATSERQLLRYAAAVEQGSSHPLARAICEEAAGKGLSLPQAENAKALEGRAVTAMVEGRPLAVASPRYAAGQASLGTAAMKRIEGLEAQGKTVVVLLDNSNPIGFIAMRDEVRPEADRAISDLRRLGVRPIMLTGDNISAGKTIAEELDLEVEAGLLPEDKLELIHDLGLRGRVAMVGDGINDAPALARADVGISMGGGTEVALETADAALLGDSVSGVTELVRLSRATLGNVRQNIAFALGLKAVFLVTTLLGITGLWPAILSDTGATAMVTANALRLLAFRPKRMKS